MSHRGAALAGGRRTIKHTPWPVGLEVAIAEAAAGVLDAARKLQARAGATYVIEARFALIGHYDSYSHEMLPIAEISVLYPTVAGRVSGISAVAPEAGRGRLEGTGGVAEKESGLPTQRPEWLSFG
jgi:hypothetical protein